MFEKLEGYIKGEDWGNALITSAILFQINNTNIELIKYYLKTLAKTKQRDLCISLSEYLRSIVDENNIEILKDLSKVFADLEDYELAAKYLQKYVDSKPDGDVLADDYNWLGCYYNYIYNKTYDLKTLDKAIKYFKLVVEKYPTNKLYLINLCLMYKLHNQLDKAEPYWNKLLNAGGLTNDEAFEYAICSMKNSDSKQFYKYYESRFHKTKFPVKIPNVNIPRWAGENIKNSTLLIYFEQGFGDTFFVSQYLYRLKPLVKKIIFVVQDAVYTLLENNTCGIEIYPAGHTSLDSLKFDYYMPSMDIFKILNMDKKDFSQGKNIINVDKNKIEYYKKNYFDNKKIKIGVSFIGNKIGNTTRDIPLKNLKILQETLIGYQFYILNQEIPDKDIPAGFINLGKTFNDFEDTAAAIENCDLILNSDNCILNLAGVLNKKTYALFNWEYEFRWFDLTGDDVVFYKSVKPFVNKKMNDWENTINTVVDEIQKEYNS